MMRIPVLAITVVALLAACSSEAPNNGVVSVHATEDDPAGIEALAAAFTAETGTRVDISYGTSAAMADALISKQGAPADVLITPNVSDIWRAADQGALRPINNEVLLSVPAALKDPDGLWVTLDRRYAVIVVSAAADINLAIDYAELGKSPFEGQLCLSSIANSVNQAVIAMLIEDRGLKPAERIVRGWVRNLAAPPFPTEQELLAALVSGDCVYGIVAESELPATLSRVDSRPLYADVSAMGVGRHAKDPEAGQRLVEWLIRNKPTGDFDKSNGRNVGLAGWRSEDVRLLAERASYR